MRQFDGLISLGNIHAYISAYLPLVDFSERGGEPGGEGRQECTADAISLRETRHFAAVRVTFRVVHLQRPVI